ncbi:MAG: glycoside hydrolase family 16 protein [Mycobacterium sp.]
MAAGLGAAVMTGASIAVASPADTAAAGASTSSETNSGPKTTVAKRDSRSESKREADGDDRATSHGADDGGDDPDDTESPDVGESTGDTTDDVDDPGDTDDVEETGDSDDETGDTVDDIGDADSDASLPAVDEGDGPPAPVVVEDRDAKRASEPVKMTDDSVAPVTVRSTEAAPAALTTATIATSTMTSAADEVDTALIAAATSTRVTFTSMVRDWLYSVGIRSSKLGVDDGGAEVPKFIATWWLGVRSRIYRDVVIPQPGNPTQPSNPGQPPLLWETNFSSMEEALTYWGLHTGRWGQSAGENQYYTDGDNVYVDAEGNLVVEARREAAPDGLGAPHNYTSARVVTFGKQSIGVGTRVVARIQMPVTQGTLPAFWSVGLEPGHEYDWPRQGEIDIVEIPGMGTPASRRWWTGNIHGPSEANNTVDVKLHHIGADLGVDLSQDFHEYGMDWYSDRIIWHVDGVEVGRVTQAQYEALGGDWTPFSGQWDHYLILNLAVGNPWTGDPSPTAPFQAEMKVDWVKAYSL